MFSSKIHHYRFLPIVAASLGNSAARSCPTMSAMRIALEMLSQKYGAVAVSGFVALTLSPMMSAYLLKDHAHEEAGLTGWTNRVFDRVRDRYERVVGALVAPREERKAPWRLLAWSLVAWIPFVPLALAVVWGIFGASGVKAAAGPVAGGLAAVSILGALLVIAFDLLLRRRYRNVQYVLAAATLLTVLVVPFFLFAQSELAPKEDQGVIFSITLPGPTSTIDRGRNGRGASADTADHLAGTPPGGDGEREARLHVTGWESVGVEDVLDEGGAGVLEADATAHLRLDAPHRPRRAPHAPTREPQQIRTGPDSRVAHPLSR